MSHFQFISTCEDNTKKFAKNLASHLNKNDIIVLSGDLGSSKTKFTEGILSYFSLENEISSPTFTIVNEYQKENLKLYHFDVYRLADVSEFYELGGEEYLENGICLIEWGELILEALPKDYVHITFSRDIKNENTRILDINTNINRWEDYFENIKY